MPQNVSSRSPRSVPVSGATSGPFWESSASMTRLTLLFQRR